MTWSEIPWILLILVEIVVIFGYVLLERRHPSATLAWIFAVAFLPVVGLLIYLFFGRQRIERTNRRLNKLKERVRNAMRGHGPETNRDRAGALSATDDRTAPIVRLAERMQAPPATGGNVAWLLVDAVEAYAAMHSAIESAKHHIHIEFYIWRNDETGRGFRDALVKKGKEGVEVRVLVDALGSTSLPDDFFDAVRACGGHANSFSPLARWKKAVYKDRADFRNHRKILVVDGAVGFTGGINIGDEYLGKGGDQGYWRDTHIQIRGTAVLGLQQSFVEDWLWATEELLRDQPAPAPAVYFPASTEAAAGHDVVLIVDSGPDRRWTPIHRVHVQAIAAAKERVWITNPYFLPDKVMEEAIVTASLRGVDVRVLLPMRNDSRLVWYASAAFFRPLLDAGVRIFRYHSGFVHAKTLVVDNWVGTVGSANMDVRSFQLNFEINAFVFGRGFTKALARNFIRDCEGAAEVFKKDEQSLSYTTRLLRQAASLFSPLL